MLKIRLQRVGRKHDPSFRVVLTDSKNGPRSGNAVEVLGNYDAKKDIKRIDGEKVKYWISQGAKISDTVHNILVGEKIIEGKKINVLSKKSPIVKEKTEDEKKKEASVTEASINEEVKEEAPITEEKKPVEEVIEEKKESADVEVVIDNEEEKAEETSEKAKVEEEKKEEK